MGGHFSVAQKLIDSRYRKKRKNGSGSGRAVSAGSVYPSLERVGKPTLQFSRRTEFSMFLRMMAVPGLLTGANPQGFCQAGREVDGPVTGFYLDVAGGIPASDPELQAGTDAAGAQKLQRL